MCEVAIKDYNKTIGDTLIMAETMLKSTVDFIYDNTNDDSHLGDFELGKLAVCLESLNKIYSIRKNL